MTAAGGASVAEGPWFEDLRCGDVFDGAPAMTLTEGVAAVHQAVVGNRLRLTLDHDLSSRVTGLRSPMAAPSLVWDVAIGQSTPVTHHVVANLFYRGLAFRRAPALGDTLRTSAEVVALRQNSGRPGRAPTGLVVLRIHTTDQRERTVLDFWRCAMLPLRDPKVQTGFRDDLDAVGTEGGDLRADELEAVSRGWRLQAFREAVRPRGSVAAGDSWTVVGGDVVSSAPELARLTLNTARTHHDDAAGPAGRLVYGGHTVGIALSQALRAVPYLVTVVGWHGCEHLGPVREGDTLASTVEVERVSALTDGTLVHLRSRVWARRGPTGVSSQVLDWRYVGLLA